MYLKFGAYMYPTHFSKPLKNYLNYSLSVMKIDDHWEKIWAHSH